MGGSADDVEDEEDGAYWDVDADCGQTAEASILGWVGSFEVLFAHGDNWMGRVLVEYDVAVRGRRVCEEG